MTSSIEQVGLGVLRQPATVLFGPGKRDQLPDLVLRYARTILVVTDGRMAGSEEFAAIRAGLEAAGVTVHLFDAVAPDLPRDDLVEIVRRFGDTPLELVLGLGGGSCLDAAKAAAVALRHRQDIRDFYGEMRVPGPGLPVITVPTTGGTGAEVTCIAVVYDDEKGMKLGIASPWLEPVATIVDPELTLTCPPGLTAATGADALSHLVEAFTARRKYPTREEINRHLYVGKNVLADVYAAEGLRLLNRALPLVVREPHDIAARSDMMLAAFCAGMAINTTGTAGAHAIQSPIGALTHTPHGFGVAALLPYVMRFNLPERVAEFAEMGRILGVADTATPEAEQARAAIRRVEDILRLAGAPLDLATLGLKPEHFGYVADQALLATRLTANNPRELTRENILAILERGYAADLDWWEV